MPASSASCAAATNAEPFALRTYNSLPALLEAGRIGPALSLGDLPRDPGLVGLGSLTQLRGEVLILRGETWFGLPVGAGETQGQRMTAEFQSAAFLVTASVPHWVSVPLPEAVPYVRLESVIEELAQTAGVDTSKPFPLLIEGELSNLAFNVVDGRSFIEGTPIEQSELEAAQVKVEYPITQGTIVGFFADPPRKDFIHADARTHLHVLLPAEKQVGHLDRVDLNVGCVLHLPAKPDATIAAL